LSWPSLSAAQSAQPRDTFSTFSLDAFYLMARGAGPSSLAYMLGSVALSVGALAVALRLARSF